jgi:cell division transport system ATP-binding protein
MLDASPIQRIESRAPVIEFRNVSFSLNGITFLDDVSFQMGDEEFVFLVGGTGSGKTMLVRLISMDARPTAGTVRVGIYNSDTIKPKDLPHLRRQVGVIFQDNRFLDDRSVHENIALPLHVAGKKRSEIKARVAYLLDDVGLTQKSDDRPNQLSAGERQRLALARALVNDPLILLADEPTGNLDPPTELEILNLLKRINTRGIGVLIATHNYELVKRIPARIVQLKEGKLLEVELRTEA